MLSILIPLILTVIMILVWLNKHSEITAYDLSLGFFSIVLLTLGLFFLFVKTRFDTTIPLSVLMFLAIAVGPAVFVMTKKTTSLPRTTLSPRPITRSNT